MVYASVENDDGNEDGEDDGEDDDDRA